MGNSSSGTADEKPRNVAPKVKSRQSAKGAKINNAIQNIDAAIAKLDKKEVYLEKQIGKLTDAAKKKLKAGDKRGAMMMLKKKKMYEKQQLQISNTKMNLEMQKMSLDDTATNQIVTSAMISGAKTMKEVVKESHMENIDELRDDIADAMDQQNQINEMLGENIMGEELEDDDDLMAELGMMEEEEDANTMAELDMPSTNNMKTSNVKPSMQRRTSEDELAMLDGLNDGAPAPAKKQAAKKPATQQRLKRSNTEDEMANLDALLA